jgi:hypothetical protein
LSGVTVLVAGERVLSTILTAPFQVPKTALGAIAVPPFCQSPASGFPVAVTSVTNSAGNSGRPDTSVPDWSPLAIVDPTIGGIALPGFVLKGETI